MDNHILRPVQISVRTPKEKGHYFTNLGGCYYSIAHNSWRIKTKTINPSVWFEKITIELLFPSDEIAYKAAYNASNGSIALISSHQEGQIYFKNYILRQLKK